MYVFFAKILPKFSYNVFNMLTESLDVHICYEVFHTCLSIFAHAYTIGLGNVWRQLDIGVTMFCHSVFSFVDILFGLLLDLCLFCSQCIIAYYTCLVVP